MARKRLAAAEVALDKATRDDYGAGRGRHAR